MELNVSAGASPYPVRAAGDSGSEITSFSADVCIASLRHHFFVNRERKSQISLLRSNRNKTSNGALFGAYVALCKQSGVGRAAEGEEQAA